MKICTKADELGVRIRRLLPSPHPTNQASTLWSCLKSTHLSLQYLDACLPHSSLQHGETTYLELYQVQFKKLHDTLIRLLLLPSRFSRVWLCATPQMAAHQAPPSLVFFRQEHWSGLPFPSLIHESEKWKWSRSVVSNSSRPHGQQPTRLLHPWDFPGKSTGVGCLLRLED